MRRLTGLADLPRALIVDGSSTPQNRTPQVEAPLGAAADTARLENRSQEGQYFNRAPNVITAFMKDADNMVKAVNTDSIVQVTRKLNTLMDKLTNEYVMFDPQGYVKPTRWTEMVRGLEKFLECDRDAFPSLKEVARASSQIRDILDANTTEDWQEWCLM